MILILITSQRARGLLTRNVTISHVAYHLGLYHHVKHFGDQKMASQPLAADAFEAYIGALHKDGHARGNPHLARDWLVKLWSPKIFPDLEDVVKAQSISDRLIDYQKRFGMDTEAAVKSRASREDGTPISNIVPNPSREPDQVASVLKATSSSDANQKIAAPASAVAVETSARPTPNKAKLKPIKAPYVHPSSENKPKQKQPILAC
jgi:dsRNA-specific ribonuclease